MNRTNRNPKKAVGALLNLIGTLLEVRITFKMDENLVEIQTNPMNANQTPIQIQKNIFQFNRNPIEWNRNPIQMIRNPLKLIGIGMLLLKSIGLKNNFPAQQESFLTKTQFFTGKMFVFLRKTNFLQVKVAFQLLRGKSKKCLRAMRRIRKKLVFFVVSLVTYGFRRKTNYYLVKSWFPQKYQLLP